MHCTSVCRLLLSQCDLSGGNGSCAEGPYLRGVAG